MTTAVAAHTSTLNVGTSVTLLPLHDTVRLEEDVITLDLVSKVRIILGVGLGYQEADFRAFEIPVPQRVGRSEEGGGGCPPLLERGTFLFPWRIPPTGKPAHSSQSLPAARTTPSEAVGTEYFLLRLRHPHSGGLPHERIMEAIQLFGEGVIPAFG